jgi:predicted enzyme related to lactoylglutathione lyase
MARIVILAVAWILVAAGATAAPLGPDGTAGQSYPGKFTWFDLATDDPAGAKTFYGAVFGWTFSPVKDAPAGYTLIRNETGKVGGLFKHPRPKEANAGARWLSLISVRDVAAAAQAVRERGGEILLAPKTVPGRGTHAIFRDPEGAVFGVLAPEGGDAPDTPVEDGDVFWLDLFVHDPAKEAAFYAAVAGYDVEVGEISGRPRTLLSSQGIARAGVTKMAATQEKPGWLPYILVSDVPATLARAVSAGGRVIMAPRAEVLEGNVAVIADPEGGVIGIVNWHDDAPRPGAPR